MVKGNKDLMDTPIVKGQVERYLYLKYDYKKILERLFDIHLIEITEEELIEFIEKYDISKENYKKFL
jgi:hypothetical protein